MNTLYFVRHGENPANLTREFSHKKVDYPLTEKGVRQAQQTAAFFRHKEIHEIYSSPLRRAMETAEIIAEAVKREVIVLEQFRETNVGSLEGQPPGQALFRLHDQVIEDWRKGRHDSSFPDGEDYVTLLRRVREGFQEILRGKSGRNIVVVSHGGIFAATVRDICPEIDPEQTIRRGKPNCSITEMEMALRDDGQVAGRLRGWAACDHLSEA